MHAEALPGREIGLGQHCVVAQLTEFQLKEITMVSIRETNTLVLFEKAAYAVNQVLCFVWQASPHKSTPDAVLCISSLLAGLFADITVA